MTKPEIIFRNSQVRVGFFEKKIQMLDFWKKNYMCYIFGKKHKYLNLKVSIFFEKMQLSNYNNS